MHRRSKRLTPVGFDAIMDVVRRAMCDEAEIKRLMRRFIREGQIGQVNHDALKHYARLTLVTKTPEDRATVYLRDTGSPESACGRLLLRAAERALRAYSEAGSIKYDNFGTATGGTP